MKSIVIAYEDKYFNKLHDLVKRLRKDRGDVGHVIEPRPIQGTGNFIREVPSLMRTPLAYPKHPPDLVVCLADADRPGNLVPNAPPAPMSKIAAELDAWVLNLEQAWRQHLAKQCNLDEKAAARLRTVCLRWNKESLLLSSPEALCDYAREYGCEAAVRATLAGCSPSPLELADGAFFAEYRDPEGCMHLVCKKIHDRKYKKGIHDENILNKYVLAAGADARRAEILRRSPDLARLLDVLA